MRALRRAILALALAGLPTLPAQAADDLRVRATEAAAPCVLAAARARPEGPRLELTTGDLKPEEATDVLVGSAVEITRAVESAHAVEGSDVDVARIPWVLVARAGAPAVTSLEDVIRTGNDVWVLGGPGAYEARRALESVPPGRLHESRDPGALARARLAILPLSLAGGTDGSPLSIPPILVRAAVAAGSHRPDASRALVRYLASTAGQDAFARCDAESHEPGRP